MKPFVLLALALGLACGSAQAKPGRRAPKKDQAEGLPEDGGNGDEVPAKSPRSGPNWGARAVPTGKIVQAAAGGDAGIGLARVSGIKGAQENERLFVLSDDFNGVLAELVVRKAARGGAQCEIVALRARFARAELPGKPVVREKDVRLYLKRFDFGGLAGGAGGIQQDKNPVAMASFLTEGYRSAAIDAMTGAALRQEVETVGAVIELFLPASTPDSPLNWFGLRAVIAQAQKSELVGRYPDRNEVMRFKVSGSSQKFQLAVRPTFAGGLPSQAWLYLTLAETRADRLQSSEAKSLGAPGALTLESSVKGSGVALGGAVMPFDGFVLGLGLGAPVSQALTVKEKSAGGSAVANGSWTRLDVEGFGGVRFPRPSGAGGGVAFELRGGLTYRKEAVKLKSAGADASSRSYEDMVKWVSAGIGYVN